MAESIRYKTYNNVVNTLKCLGEQHLEIQTVTTGDIFDIDLNKNNLFPLYHIDVTGVEVSLQEKTFTCSIYIMDIVAEDQSNEQTVLSDTLQITTDIIGLLKHGEILNKFNADDGLEHRYYVEDDFTCTPFTERFDNAVSGWNVDIDISVESELNTCDIPIDNTTKCVK
tara:strand:+ start:4044 stop:4550 length:507 start_codon:yes stop_codon:yes gene_type:complete